MCPCNVGHGILTFFLSLSLHFSVLWFLAGCKITAEAQSEACHLKEMRPNY